MFNLDLKAKQKFPGEREERRRASQMPGQRVTAIGGCDVGVASAAGCASTATARPRGQNEAQAAAAPARPLGSDI